MSCNFASKLHDMYLYKTTTFPHQPLKSISKGAFLHRFHWMLLLNTCTWLQCYTMWPKIVDGKNISGSTDTNWFKPNFTWIINCFWLIFNCKFYQVFYNTALRSNLTAFPKTIQQFQWYFSNISWHMRNHNIVLWWPFLCLVLASI